MVDSPTPPKPAEDRAREGIDAVREESRLLMLKQPTTPDRETYSGGFAQGLCHAIRRIDTITAALTTSPAVAEVEIINRAIDRMGWPEIHAFMAELRRGQDIREDAGGFMLRAIKALFGVRAPETVETYRSAARALTTAALSSLKGDR